MCNFLELQINVNARILFDYSLIYNEAPYNILIITLLYYTCESMRTSAHACDSIAPCVISFLKYFYPNQICNNDPKPTITYLRACVHGVCIICTCAYECVTTHLSSALSCAYIFHFFYTHFMRMYIAALIARTAFISL